MKKCLLPISRTTGGCEPSLVVWWKWKRLLCGEADLPVLRPAVLVVAWCSSYTVHGCKAERVLHSGLLTSVSPRPGRGGSAGLGFPPGPPLWRLARTVDDAPQAAAVAEPWRTCPPTPTPWHTLGQLRSVVSTACRCERVRAGGETGFQGQATPSSARALSPAQPPAPGLQNLQHLLLQGVGVLPSLPPCCHRGKGIQGHTCLVGLETSLEGGPGSQLHIIIIPSGSGTHADLSLTLRLRQGI